MMRVKSCRIRFQESESEISDRTSEFQPFWFQISDFCGLGHLPFAALASAQEPAPALKPASPDQA